MRQIVSPERSGRLRRETVEVWSNPSFKGPFGYEIIRGGHKNEGEP